MKTRSRDKRAARQRKHTHKWAAGTSGLQLLNFKYYSENIAPALLDRDQRFDISKAGWASLFVITNAPAATVDHWADLATSANLSLMLAEIGIGKEHESVFIRAQEALTRMYARAQTGAWRLDGPGVQDVRDMLHLHDQQCELATNQDISAALVEIARRIQAGQVFEFQFSEAA